MTEIVVIALIVTVVLFLIGAVLEVLKLMREGEL